MIDLKGIRDSDMLTGGSYQTTHAGNEYEQLLKEWEHRFFRAESIDNVLCKMVINPIKLGNYEIRIWQRPVGSTWKHGWAGRVYQNETIEIDTPLDWSFSSKASVIHSAVESINQLREFNLNLKVNAKLTINVDLVKIPEPGPEFIEWCDQSRKPKST